MFFALLFLPAVFNADIIVLQRELMFAHNRGVCVIAELMFRDESDADCKIEPQ